MKKILFLLILLSCVRAEVALLLGLTQGNALQTLSGDVNQSQVSSLSLRPAYFVEVDSVDHPLFLANDMVVLGLGWLTETAHKDLMMDEKYVQLSIPVYATYYLRYGIHSIGLGFSLNLMQLRYRNHVSMQGQQLGKHLFWRINGDNNYLELGVMQLCAQGNYAEEDVVSFYDTTNFVLRYGFYLGGKNTL